MSSVQYPSSYCMRRMQLSVSLASWQPKQNGSHLSSCCSFLQCGPFSWPLTNLQLVASFHKSCENLLASTLCESLLKMAVILEVLGGLLDNASSG